LTPLSYKNLRKGDVSAISFEESTGEGTLEKKLKSDVDVGGTLMLQERHEEARAMLKSLSPKEQRVLRSRFGFDGEALTLAQTGKLMNITREGARYIEKRALKLLREKY